MNTLVLLLLLVPTRPLSLEEAITLAVGNEPRVQVAQVEGERARLRTLRAQLAHVNASVDVDASALYVVPSLVAPPPAAPYGGPLALGSLTGFVGVPVFSGFRVESNVAAAEALQEAADVDVVAEKRAVAAAVARAYWGVRRLDLLAATHQLSSERLQESEQLVHARVNAGLAAGLDENRARARRVQLDVDVRTLEAQRREASVQLAALLGLNEPVELTDTLPTFAGAAAGDGGDVEADVATALSRRPELRSLALQARALDEQKKAAESEYWPQLDAMALAQVGNNPQLAGVGARSVGGVDANLQAGLVFKMNLFDTFATSHAVEDMAHRQRLALAEQRAVARDVENAVRLAHARLVSLREQRAALESARVLDEDNLKILAGAYGRGEVLFTEVLDAQLALSTAERQIVDVDAQTALAAAELQAAIGDAP